MQTVSSAEAAEILATPTSIVATPVTPVQPVPKSTSQEPPELIKAQLESQQREEWCNTYAQEEVARYFRGKFCEYEQNRQFEAGMSQNGIPYPASPYGRRW
jgi:hypothetical protein